MNNCIIINGQEIELTREQIGKIVAAHQASNTPLSEIPVSSTFKIDDYEFVVLEQCGVSTTVILKDMLPDTTAFSKSNNRYDGSYADQSCSAFAEELEKIIGADNLLVRSVDLTADDGLKDYGRIDRKVSLLTADEYRSYVDILDKHKPKKWWWLATPHSTATHGNDRWVKCVSPSGYISKDDYDYDDYGFRPFCILKSNIFVSK